MLLSTQQSFQHPLDTSQDQWLIKKTRTKLNNKQFNFLIHNESLKALSVKFKTYSYKHMLSDCLLKHFCIRHTLLVKY